MTMKLPRKLLSCLLVAAICITTVFGCLMTVSAESAGTYTIVGEEITEDVITEATATVTFEIPAGVSYGAFDVAKVGASDTDLFGSVTAKVTGGTPLSGSYSAADFGDEDKDGFGDAYCNTDISDGDLARISFEIGAADSEGTLKAYTSVTLELTFTFANGTATKGLDYAVAINDFDFTGRYDGQIYTELDGTNGVIKTGCEHIITVSEDDLVNTDSVNGYSVYEKSICSICKTEFGYQVVPTKTPGKVIYWNGETEAEIADNDETGSADNPIIIDNAEELAYIATIQTDAANATTGKYYKVADGIDAIVLQPESEAAEAIMSLSNSSDVKNYFEGGKLADIKPWVSNTWKKASTVYPFAGNFDGNGVTIYGMYFNNPSSANNGTYTGLFSYVAGDPKVENVTIANAYLVSAAHMGAVSSYLQIGNVNGTYNKIALENCAVINSYMESHLMNYTAGVLTGSTGVSSATNCIVYGNNARNVVVPNTAEGGTGYELCMIAQNVGYNAIQNCVALGTVPYAKYCPSHDQWFNSSYGVPFVNVYTDQPTTNLKSYKYLNGEITAYSDDVAKDTFCAGLTPTDTIKVKDEAFVDELNTNADSIVWQLDSKTGYPTFVRDVAKIDTTENVSYYSSDTADTVVNDPDENGVTQAGTAEDPIIIDSADELAYLQKNVTVEAGTYYKISDEIDTIVFQSKANVKTMTGLAADEGGLEALKNMTAAEVEAYFRPRQEGTVTGGYGNLWSDSGVFKGTLDGNGVEIYGMSAAGGGLFTKAGAGATIKNLTIKSSIGFSQGGAAGIIIAQGNYATGGTITIENCVVANCVTLGARKNDHSNFGGVVVGINSDNILTIDNCLVYGNVAKSWDTEPKYGYAKGYALNYGLFGQTGNDTLGGAGAIVKNSIILDTVPYSVAYKSRGFESATYENVYSNMFDKTFEAGTYQAEDYAINYKITVTPTVDANGNYTIKWVRTNVDTGATATMSKYLGKTITAADPSAIKGLAANGVVTDLNTANGETVWSCTANGYPTPMAAFADTISSVSSLDLDLKAVNLDYNNDGSFNLNFHYEPASDGLAPDLYVAQADLSGFILNPTKSTYAGEGLSADALMYTVKSLSAREIGDILLPTAVYASGNTALWGKTEQISIKDYAVAVINGEAVYTENASDTVKQQDKDVAAAVINYGEAAKAALEQPYDGAAGGGKTIYWDGTSTTAPADSDNDGIYEITKASELAYIALNANSDTAGKTYKVADGISTIVLQKKSTIDNLGGLSKLTGLLDADDIQKFYEDNASSLTKWVIASSTTAGFAGTFDGNGAVICGMYSYNTGATCGLFSGAGAAITIKNLALKNNYVYGDAAGLISGQSNSSGRFTVNNCVIANNVVLCNRNNDANSYGGLLYGVVSSGIITVDNCLIYGNNVTHTKIAMQWNGTPFHNNEYTISYGLWGKMAGPTANDASTYNTVKNSIVLGTLPGTVDISSYWGWYGYTATNVYTDMLDKEIINTDWTGTGETKVTYNITATLADDGKVTLTDKNSSKTYTTTLSSGSLIKVSPADVLGSAAAANMPNLDWTNTWAYGFSGEYPTPITSATAESAGKIMYWDGTTKTAPTQDGDNVYVIDSPEKLAYIAQNGADAGSVYKVADGIDAFILQPESMVEAAGGLTKLMSLSDYTETQEYFTDNKSNAKNWIASGAVFNGTFDGNGVEIYGMYYGKGDWVNAGLFSQVSTSTTIKNVSVKNSYLSAESYAGAIFAYADTDAYTDIQTDVVTLDSVEVVNTWVYNTHYNSAETPPYYNYRNGIVLGSCQVILHVNNCIVYGSKAENAATNAADADMPAFGTCKNNNLPDTSVAHYEFSNSIILGAYPFKLGQYNVHVNTYYSNVYTDMDKTAGVYTYKDEQITQITNLEQLKGDNAQSIVDTINGATTDSRDMYVGNAWGYPSFEKAGVMPNANQIAYDGLTMNKYDVYTATNADFSMYATSLNLKTNPYIAFTFAFNKDYKENRGDITVTFTNAAGTVIKETTVLDENGYLNDGWTNNEGAGRYHLYRLTDVAVEDLCDYITVSVKYGENEAVEFGKFSVEGFALDIQNAYKQDPCQYYATRVEAAKALLYYTRMINERYGNVE